MPNEPRHYYRLMARLREAAKGEIDHIRKNMPSEFRQRVTGLTSTFEDRPSSEMLDRGVERDQVSLTDGATDTCHVFLMNLHDRYGSIPGDFRRELRRTILREMADHAGVEVDLAD